MFKKEINYMSKNFEILYFTEDYSVITKPTITDQIFIILEGSVVLTSEQNVYISAKKAIKLRQRQRLKK